MDIPEPEITHIPMLSLDVDMDLDDEDSTCKSRHQLMEDNAVLRSNLLKAREHDKERNSVLVRANAQLVVQGLHAAQLKRKLFTKEQKKETTGTKRRKLLASRWGRHLTSRKFRDALKKLELEDNMAAREKQRKKSIRELRKEKREWRQAEVKRRQQQRKIDIERWEHDRDRARAAKEKVPAKPKAVKRADTPGSIVERLEELEEEAGGETDEDDEDEDDE
ncbi:hypothetical protein FIBSPDRAFT_963996 [Athelia psychrophila]|uniref:Uncharacterized protein n=1 Tax=Athelia psychrophila TaxID=1759441 RepID=A0A165YB21_9AGAM|nr:hypothetical protein FIBSPDRAFT_963996 [Fibularhizoctonia sp. CBS 109695]